MVGLDDQGECEGILIKQTGIGPALLLRLANLVVFLSFCMHLSLPPPASSVFVWSSIKNEIQDFARLNAYWKRSLPPPIARFKEICFAASSDAMPAEPPNRVTVTLWISEPSSSNASSGQQQSSANWASSSTHLQQQQQQAGNDGAGATSSTPSTQADTEDVDEDTDSSGSYSWGVPLTTFYAPEITLNRDLQKAEQLGLVEHGDILEIFKAPSSGNNDQTRINALTPSPDHVMLVRVTRQCWTPEGASTQLQVRARAVAPTRIGQLQ